MTAFGVLSVVGLFATSVSPASASLASDAFVGIGDAIVLDFITGTSCEANFVLFVDENHDGWEAVLRFLPICLRAFPPETWPFYWPFHPFDFALTGNWETGFSGDSQLVLFRAHVEIGPYGDGIDIPAQGWIVGTGPIEFTWTGTVTDVNKLT